MATSLSPTARIILKALAQGSLPLPVVSPRIMVELTLAGYADIAKETLRLFGKYVSVLEITEPGRDYVREMIGAAEVSRSWSGEAPPPKQSDRR